MLAILYKKCVYVANVLAGKITAAPSDKFEEKKPW
jgi:hypothetical protein